MYGSPLLAALVVALFTVTPGQQGGAAPIDGKRFTITTPNLRGGTSLERLRSVFLRVLDNEAGVVEDTRLLPGRFDLHLIQVGGTWAAYPEFRGRVYPATGAIEEPDGPPGQQRMFRRGSGCWWLWLFTGTQVCWEAHA